MPNGNGKYVQSKYVRLKRRISLAQRIATHELRSRPTTYGKQVTELRSLLADALTVAREIQQMKEGNGR